MDELDLMSQAVAAASKAAELVLTGYRKAPATSTKSSAVDLVTEYDLRSERLIRQALAKSGLPIVGEEEGGEPIPGPTWYIDPIDGTTNFAHGHPMFCVSIGLLDHQGTPILGAVVAPALAVSWHGCRGHGAFRNGQPCRVSDTRTLEQALLSTGFVPGSRAEVTDVNVAWFRRLLPHVRGIRRDGSAALDLCMTADGTFTGYWELGLNPWDVAGGAAIALSAGATLTDPAGHTPDYCAGNLVATNGHIHAALLQHLR